MSSAAARNLLRRHYDSYGGYSMVTTMMDDDHHQQQQDTSIAAEGENQGKEREEIGLAATNGGSKAADDSWLQLGIGPSSSSPSAAASAAAVISPSVELRLFSDDKPSASLPTFPCVSRPMMPTFSSTLPMQQYRPAGTSPWGFSSYLMNMQQVGGTSRSLMNMPAPQLDYNVQRFPILPPPPLPMPMRVVRTPARSTGVWFILKAADNQVREPFLPQIPKSYLRIKDGRMTVRLLKKYLVNKLGLVDESEVLNLLPSSIDWYVSFYEFNCPFLLH